MSNKEILDLTKKLEESQLLVKDLTKQSLTLRKAIWDMLNYASIFLVLLDSKMIIKLCNWRLTTALGFQEDKEVIGKCWLTFIPEEEIDRIKMIHHDLAVNHNDQEKQKNLEVTNDIKTINGEIITVKWFNVQINSIYNMTMSLGLPINKPNLQESEDSIRAYYRDIIDKDRTMIRSLRDVALKGVEHINVCEIDEDLI
jgi:PAS domain-containing protein